MGATALCFPVFNKPSVTCLRYEKKTILKGNITTTYIKHEMLKTVSFKPSFGLSVEI